MKGRANLLFWRFEMDRYKLKFADYAPDGISVIIEVPCPFCEDWNRTALCGGYNDIIHFQEVQVTCSHCGMSFYPAVFNRTAREYARQYAQILDDKKLALLKRLAADENRSQIYQRELEKRRLLEDKKKEAGKMKLLKTGGIDPEIYDCYQEELQKGENKGGGSSGYKRKKPTKRDPWYRRPSGYSAIA